jgi:hypothetical protein
MSYSRVGHRYNEALVFWGAIAQAASERNEPLIVGKTLISWFKLRTAQWSRTLIEKFDSIELGGIRGSLGSA